MEERDHVNSGKVGWVGVDGSDIERVVGCEMVVLDLNHRLTGLTGELVVKKFMNR